MRTGFSFSLKRLLGITGAKQKVARSTGIPTTKQGRKLKTGKATSDLLSGKDVGKNLKTIAAMKAIDLLTEKAKKK